MCDDNNLDDMMDELRKNSDVTRRRFGALSLGAGIAEILPRAASAAEVTEADLEIKTPDGVADAYFVHPTKGTHAAVLIWTDIFGLRPAFKQMANRLAESGYAVLVPNPFYRISKVPVFPTGTKMQDPEGRKLLFAAAGTLTPEVQVADAKAFIAFLDSQPAVNKSIKMGTTGYCMGGSITMRTAAAFPERIGAAASFHGGGLVTDKPESPHLLVAKIKAHCLFAIAEDDDMKQPEAKDVLHAVFAESKVPAEIEVYAGTKHGWCPPDSAAYNEIQAEKAWSRMLALFKAGLA
ncbi:MAG: dienelactone hydrolase family protein [Steroidobacteraceae bacterium]